MGSCVRPKPRLKPKSPAISCQRSLHHSKPIKSLNVSLGFTSKPTKEIPGYITVWLLTNFLIQSSIKFLVMFHVSETDLRKWKRNFMWEKKKENQETKSASFPIHWTLRFGIAPINVLAYFLKLRVTISLEPQPTTPILFEIIAGDCSVWRSSL